MHRELLFPTPIYMTNMDRKFTKQELQFVKQQMDRWKGQLALPT